MIRGMIQDMIRGMIRDKNITYLNMVTVGAGIIERKLRSTKVRLFTVPCCSIILFFSEGVKRKRI